MQLNSFLTDIFCKVWLTSANLRVVTLVHSETVRKWHVTESLRVLCPFWKILHRSDSSKPRPEGYWPQSKTPGISLLWPLPVLFSKPCAVLGHLTSYPDDWKLSLPVFPCSVLPNVYHWWSYLSKYNFKCVICLLKYNFISIVLCCFSSYLPDKAMHALKSSSSSSSISVCSSLCNLNFISVNNVLFLIWAQEWFTSCIQSCPYCFCCLKCFFTPSINDFVLPIHKVSVQILPHLWHFLW